MKRGEKDERFLFLKNVSEPSNPPDELAQNASKKKSPSDELFHHFPSFNYSRDSNSIFQAAGIIEEIFFGCAVFLRTG